MREQLLNIYYYYKSVDKSNLLLFIINCTIKYRKVIHSILNIIFVSTLCLTKQAYF